MRIEIGSWGLQPPAMNALVLVVLLQVASAGSPPRELEALTDEAASLVASGRHREAEQRLIEVVRRLEQQPGSGHTSSLAVSYAMLAQIQLVQGKLTAAEQHARAAQLLQKQCGASRTDRVVVDTVVSRILFAEERYAEALENQLLVVRALMESAPGSRTGVATAHNDLGMIRAALGDLKAARESIGFAVAECQSIHDPQSPCGLFLGNLALVSFQLGDLSGAESLFRESIQRVEAAEGADSQNLGILLAEQSELLKRLGRKSEARQVRRRAESIMRSATQAPSRHTIDVHALSRER